MGTSHWFCWGSNPKAYFPINFQNHIFLIIYIRGKVEEICNIIYMNYSWMFHITLTGRSICVCCRRLIVTPGGSFSTGGCDRWNSTLESHYHPLVLLLLTCCSFSGLMYTMFSHVNKAAASTLVGSFDPIDNESLISFETKNKCLCHRNCLLSRANKHVTTVRLVCLGRVWRKFHLTVLAHSKRVLQTSSGEETPQWI